MFIIIIIIYITNFYWIQVKITLPSVLESIIYIFIFSAEILGEINNFYGIIPHWDTILHTINGFLAAGIGFSLIDLLNKNSKRVKLSPAYVAIVAFCFSMTIGVLWEFFEFGADKYFNLDMQKDEIVSEFSSVEFDETKSNKAIKVKDIQKTEIYTNDGVITIDGGYLDIGIKDTMKDLIVNFIGAIVYSFIGYFYIKGRDEYKFAERFIPKRKTKQEIEETRLADMLLKKKRKKKDEKEKNKEE